MNSSLVYYISLFENFMLFFFAFLQCLNLNASFQNCIKKQNLFIIVTNQIRIDQICTYNYNFLFDVLKSEISKICNTQYKYNSKCLNKPTCHHKTAIKKSFPIS